jgi:hypothetical protein
MLKQVADLDSRAVSDSEMSDELASCSQAISFGDIDLYGEGRTRQRVEHSTKVRLPVSGRDVERCASNLACLNPGLQALVIAHPWKLNQMLIRPRTQIPQEVTQ